MRIIRTSILLTILSLIGFQSFSQTPYRKKVIHRVTNILIEEYDTSDSLSTVKIGYYARYYPDEQIKKSGYYQNNMRTGVWDFYDTSGAMTYKYNYTTGLTIFSRPDTLSKHYLRIANVDTAFYDGLEQVPEFVGGAGEMEDFLRGTLRYPTIARQNNIEGYVIATFNINANGFPESPKIVKPLGYGCDDEVLRVINLMPRWVPARRQSEVRQLYYMAFKFEIKK